VHVVLRLEAEALAVAFLPGRGTQVAERNLALAAIELGHLAEVERVTFAGAAGEIVHDAAAHALKRALAARTGEAEVIHRDVRHELDASGHSLGECRTARGENRGRRHCDKTKADRGNCNHSVSPQCGGTIDVRRLRRNCVPSPIRLRLRARSAKTFRQLTWRRT